MTKKEILDHFYLYKVFRNVTWSTVSFRSSLLLIFRPFGAVLITVVLALPLALASDWVAADGGRFDAVWGCQIVNCFSSYNIYSLNLQFSLQNHLLTNFLDFRAQEKITKLFPSHVVPAVFLGIVVVVLVTLGVSDMLSSAESVRFCLLGGGAFLVLSLVVDSLGEKTIKVRDVYFMLVGSTW